ncbi:hypothetical protein BKI52_06930 [marine bacterium AO1-C]|nr:hypothetical protein BKI52_06930 [marine bacterium AO1-C]
MDTIKKDISYHELKTKLRQNTTNNQLEAVKDLLEQYPEIIDARYEEGLTCLMIASNQGNLAMVKLLLAKDAHLDAEDFYQNTSLLKAIENKRVAVANYLLAQGADPNHQSSSFDNALHLGHRNLERQDFWAMLKLLLAHGADIDLLHYNRQNLLTEATDYDADLELTRFLLEQGANPNQVTHYANTPLNNACERGNISIIEVLLQRGANINQCTCRHLGPGWSTHGDEDEGFNALMRATHKNNELIVRLLIARGADVNVQSMNTTRGTFDGVVFGKTALQIALEKQHFSIAQLLLDAGADINIKDDTGKSPQDYLKNGQIAQDQTVASSSTLNHSLMQEMAAGNAPIKANEWGQMLAEHQVFLENKTKDGHWQVLDASGLAMGIFQGAKSDKGQQLAPQFANLTGMDLQSHNLSYANLLGCWGEGTDFRGSTFIGALLVDAYLPQANFEGVVLTNADFSRTDLTNANFRNALLKGTDFENCNLTGADFTGAQILGAKFDGANIDQIKGIL